MGELINRQSNWEILELGDWEIALNLEGPSQFAA